MKFVYLILLFSLFAKGLYSQTDAEPEKQSLQIEGQITNSEDNPMIGAIVQVYQGAKVIGTYPVDLEGKYSFKLPLDGDYTVVVSAQKTVTKKFMVSTRGVPPERAVNKFSTIQADLGLFEKMDGIDYSILNQPLQKYMYKADKTNFGYDEAYFQQMLGGLQRLRELEEAARNKKRELEANYASAIKTADKAFQKKDWATAKANYTKAKDLKPGESYPKDQLVQIDIILKDQDALNKKLEEEKAGAAKAVADKAAADAKAKADADALAKKKADEDAARLAKEKADKAAADAKAKADADALAKKKADEDAARLAKEKADKEIADAKAKGDSEAARLAKEKADKAAADAKAKADADALAKKKADEDAARLAKEKADKEIADAKVKGDSEATRLAKEKAAADAKVKSDADALAKKKADEAARLAKEKADALAKKDAEEKAKHTISPVLGEDKYKSAIKKADDLFKMKRYADAKISYEDALIAKASDKYAKERLAEIEKLLKSDTATAETIDSRMKALLLKYPSGVTEETISGPGVVIIQRAVNKESVVYIYQRKIFNWGGTSYFRDGTAITESIFEQETKP